MSQPSPDAKAVVRAAEALTTQVRRIADALETPAVRYDVAAHDDPTTGDDDAVAPTCWHTEPGSPCDWDRCRQPDRLAAGDPGTDPATTPPLGPQLRAAAEEDAQRTTRRDSLRNLLDRLDRSTVHHYDEAQLLRQHIETEIREADTARSVAAGNKRHVQVMYGELTAAQAAIERARAECAAIAREVYGQHDEDDDGKREAVGRVIAALDGTEPPTTVAESPDTEMLAAIFEGFGLLLATSSRDWSEYAPDAWLYAVILGWDCEQAEHDETCTHGAMEEMQQRHGWDDDAVDKARRYRAAVRALVASVPATEG